MFQFITLWILTKFKLISKPKVKILNLFNYDPTLACLTYMKRNTNLKGGHCEYMNTFYPGENTPNLKGGF